MKEDVFSYYCDDNIRCKQAKTQPAAYDGMTQQEVADSLGITRTAVYQIEQRAFKKFKRELAKRIKNIEDLLGD